MGGKDTAAGARFMALRRVKYVELAAFLCHDINPVKKATMWCRLNLTARPNASSQLLLDLWSQLALAFNAKYLTTCNWPCSAARINAVSPHKSPSTWSGLTPSISMATLTLVSSPRIAASIISWPNILCRRLGCASIACCKDVDEYWVAWYSSGCSDVGELGPWSAIQYGAMVLDWMLVDCWRCWRKRRCVGSTRFWEALLFDFFLRCRRCCMCGDWLLFLLFLRWGFFSRCLLRLALLFGRGGKAKVTRFVVVRAAAAIVLLGEIEDGDHGFLLDRRRTVVFATGSSGGAPRHGVSKFGRKDANGEAFIYVTIPGITIHSILV